MSAENVVVAEHFTRAEERLPAVAAVAQSPMAMVADAVQRGMDPATIKALMELAERNEANEARRAYNQAFNDFKADVPKIIRSTLVTDGPLKGKRYADKYAIVSAVTAALSRHGLSASWRTTKDEKDWIEVTCTLRHVMGHAESDSKGGPPDTGPGRNTIQARSSTNSYLEKITLKAICGLAESGDDDDGRGGKGAKMSDKALADWLVAIDMCDTAEQAEACWTQVLAASKEAGDIEAHETMRAAMLQRRKFIREKKAEPAPDPKPEPEAPAEITVIDAIAKLASFKSADAMAEWADHALTNEIKVSDKFTRAYRARLDAIKLGGRK